MYIKKFNTKGNVSVLILLALVAITASLLTYTVLTWPKNKAKVLTNKEGLCFSSDKKFCEFALKLKSLVDSKNFDAIVALQKLEDLTCDSSNPYQLDVCKGKSNGTKLKVYSVGYNQGEGALFDGKGMINMYENYLKSAGVPSYRESRSSGDSGTVLFLNSKLDRLLKFMLVKVKGEWVLSYPLMGLVTMEELLLNKTVQDASYLLPTPTSVYKNGTTEIQVHNLSGEDSSSLYLLFKDGKFVSSKIDEFTGEINPDAFK